MKDYIYFGLKLTNKEKLVEMVKNVFKLNDSDIILDHVTLMHVSQHDEELYNTLNKKVGIPVRIVIDKLGQSDKALAFGVYLSSFSNMCKNKNPHITITTFNNGKPIDSNSITDWEYIDSFVITTKLVKI